MFGSKTGDSSLHFIQRKRRVNQKITKEKTKKEIEKNRKRREEKRARERQEIKDKEKETALRVCILKEYIAVVTREAHISQLTEINCNHHEKPSAPSTPKKHFSPSFSPLP